MKKFMKCIICFLLVVSCFTVGIVAEGMWGCRQAEAASGKVKLNKKKATLIVGQELRLKISGTKSKVSWKSSNKAVAVVNAAGKVRAKKKGYAIITATVNKKAYKCKITVIDPNISDEALVLDVGQSYEISIKGTKNPVKWYSEDEAVATVSEEGSVTAVSEGLVNIVGEVLGKKFTCVALVMLPVADIGYAMPFEDFIYIEGSINEKGNRFIKHEETEPDGGKKVYGVVADEKAELLTFIYLAETAAGVAEAVEMVYMYQGGSLFCKYNSFDKAQDIGCAAGGYFTQEDYAAGNMPDFWVPGNDQADSADIVLKAKAAFQAGFDGWVRYLLEANGYTLQVIGFVE